MILKFLDDDNKLNYNKVRSVIHYTLVKNNETPAINCEQFIIQEEYKNVAGKEPLKIKSIFK